MYVKRHKQFDIGCGAIINKIHYYIILLPPIDLVSLFLEDWYAAEEEEDGHGEERAEDGQPLDALQRGDAHEEGPPPHQHLTEVVRVSGPLPQA